jgi:hypothetical protein
LRAAGYGDTSAGAWRGKRPTRQMLIVKAKASLVIKFFTCYELADPPINGGFFFLHNIEV